MGKVTTVAGIERFPTMQHGLLDTSITLNRCKHCGHEAGFRRDPARDGSLRAECSNTSCGIATPFHYRTRETAAIAWNRTPTAE